MGRENKKDKEYLCGICCERYPESELWKRVWSDSSDTIHFLRCPGCNADVIRLEKDNYNCLQIKK